MAEIRKTDLAVEAKELAEHSAGKTTRLPGIKAREDTVFGFPLTRVEVLNRAGEQALGKPHGTYLTLSLASQPRDREEILRVAKALAAMLTSLGRLPKEGLALVAGLGNRAITPDAVGPKTADHIFVTRHLVQSLPQQFGALRPVAAINPGVAGITGVESGELLASVVRKLQPACVIAVDALAARRKERICRTIQVADTGITPGSGVGNQRMTLCEDTLSVPVIAVGVPTVVEAATLCADLLENAGKGAFDPAPFRQEGAELFVTPRNVDSEVDSLAKAMGFGISAALHVDFSVEDVEKWTS